MGDLAGDDRRPSAVEECGDPVEVVLVAGRARARPPPHARRRGTRRRRRPCRSPGRRPARRPAHRWCRGSGSSVWSSGSSPPDGRCRPPGPQPAVGVAPRAGTPRPRGSAPRSARRPPGSSDATPHPRLLPDGAGSCRAAAGSSSRCRSTSPPARARPSPPGRPWRHGGEVGDRPVVVDVEGQLPLPVVLDAHATPISAARASAGRPGPALRTPNRPGPRCTRRCRSSRWERPPGPSGVDGDVGPARSDGERHGREVGYPGRPRPVPRGAGRRRPPRQAAVAAPGRVAERAGGVGEVAADRDAVVPVPELHREDASRRAADERHRRGGPGVSAVLADEDARRVDTARAR